MALNNDGKPFGLRDVRITPVNANGSLGTGVDLPSSQVFKFGDSASMKKLRGDDKDVAIAESENSVEWELEAGGISLAAYKAMAGGTVTDEGVTPNQTKTYLKKTTDKRPYFQVEGQAISESGGDFHAVVFKCKCEKLDGELADGEFYITKATGFAIGNSSDEAYKFVQNETVTAIS